MNGYISDYCTFLNNSKTERFCSREVMQRLQSAGFVPLKEKSSLSTGDRVFKNIKDRTVLAAVVGRDPSQLRIVGSHVDAPKLDLKPMPFFEQGRLALMELHDYGWIKPYQWINTPLALCGIIFTTKGESIEFSIGLDRKDPIFSIPDLPPHISAEQMKKSMAEAFTAEQLNALCGNVSSREFEEGTGARNKVLTLLKDRYGLDTEDFSCADLSLVPAAELREVGFDRALLGGYGQDDRACVHASLTALTEMEIPQSTAVGFFVDKEEVASTGDTSAQSFALRNFTVTYAGLLGPDGKDRPYDPDVLLEEAQSISGDVTTGYDPNFPEMFDDLNIAYLGGGVAVEKYGAAGSGKFRANEASAEFMQKIRSILKDNDIPWQTGTLARLGKGGGGTIAQFLSRYGMDCVDAGPPLLGMHTPLEISAKKDLYATYRLYAGFFKK